MTPGTLFWRRGGAAGRDELPLPVEPAPRVRLGRGESSAGGRDREARGRDDVIAGVCPVGRVSPGNADGVRMSGVGAAAAAGDGRRGVDRRLRGRHRLSASAR